MTIVMPSSRSFTPAGPASPTLNLSEDLSRFPTESLHSFSFAHQSEDILHNRQNVMKRSIDFMRDKLGWAANNPGIINAQAKASGDAEFQSMLQLLARANVYGGKDFDEFQPQAGLLTGPVHVDTNIFERTFAERSISPNQSDEQSPTKGHSDGLGEPFSRPLSIQSKDSNHPHSHGAHSSQSSIDLDSLPVPGRLKAARAELKRTYTDTSSLSLQTKLMDALAKPYVANENAKTDHLLSPPIVPSFGKSLNTGVHTPGSHNPGMVHGYSSRWAPAAQAIFTTEASAPWTILAANDLACLVFGVTKAEIRKLGILECVREDKREWLEEQLRAPGAEAMAKSRSPTAKSARPVSPPSTSSAMGTGITAMLLSKPSSRQVTNSRRAQTDDGCGSSYVKKKTASPNHAANKSRGVLLCGDVIPIQKRNGATGSASLWVKEKRGGLIWVLEEIVEDSARFTINDMGRVARVTEPNRSLWSDQGLIGTHVRRLVPCIPITEDEVDYDTVSRLEYYAARNTEGYNIPATISAKKENRELRVSSFPHIAGIMVLNATSLTITSSNTVFSTALFGQRAPNGLKISELIPKFDEMLGLLIEEDEVELVDGIVIPEQSFRRARAQLSIKEGTTDAAAIFSRPTGLLAKHRDGSSINVDVQMRVVKSESLIPEESIIEEASEGESMTHSCISSEVVYALWITYSRHLHSAIYPGGPTSPLISRPGTPPHQPSPGQSNLNLDAPSPIDLDSAQNDILSPSTILSQQIREATSEPISSIPPKDITPSISEKAATMEKKDMRKKTINEFAILEDMGQGAYGQVKLARYKKQRDKKVVLKYVTKKRILVDTWTRDRRLGTVPLEIHVLDYLRKDGLKHPNIVEMTDFFEDDLNYYIEMLPHGLPGMDLFDYIEMRSQMEEAECRNIFLQVVAALHHLHTKALVVHRDIKDENIVLDGENRVKLIDFGSAAYIKNGPFGVFVGTIGMFLKYSTPSHLSAFSTLLFPRDSLPSSFLCSITPPSAFQSSSFLPDVEANFFSADYAAPEVLGGHSYRGKEQDVWALGILLYTLVYKENPFYNVDEILDHELRVPWIMSEGSIDLIRAMLNRDVETRLTITQVRDHPWCRGE